MEPNNWTGIGMNTCILLLLIKPLTAAINTASGYL